jgi:uncharacterized circularly permuted ATP-grasp superfamily protein/uncharacterized alpha-E superfamily protein
MSATIGTEPGSSSNTIERNAGAALNYSVRHDGYDEAVEASGETRPTWRSLSRAIARLTPGELIDRQRQADRLVEAEGASYVFNDDGSDTSRPWRLDPVPLVLGGVEWAAVEQGIAQRARVIDRMIADFNGPRQLMRDRVVAPTAVFGAPGYLLAAQGMRPKNSRWLTVYAADLVRLSDGHWRILRDVTDAPSGAGYALVNRNASAQLLPGVVRDMAPLSLAPFFADMRSALDSAAPTDRSSPRTMVLSPGLGHPSYFEHSYLAAHLGYHLAEPRDLVVRNGRVWLRALSGLEPVDVMLRRIDGASLDPLESARGAIGVPGLARCARGGGIGLANALGSGVASTMALLPFVEAASKVFGEELLLPSLRTLWCGTLADRAEVRADLRRFVLHDVVEMDTVFGDHLDDAAVVEWETLIDNEPHRVVAQEKVTFATAPVLGADGLRPGTVVLRVLAVAGQQGISVMPGGLARVMEPSVPIVLQTSGIVKDVWILDDRPDRPLPISTRITRSMPQVDLRESLPTRAAEAMYWVGRSAERAETLARATASALAVIQGDPPLLTVLDGAWRRPVVAALGALSGHAARSSEASSGPSSNSPGNSPGDATVTPEEEFRAAVAATLVGSAGLPASLTALSRAASSARQFVSATTWRVLGELDNERNQLSTEVATAYDAGVRRRLDTILVHLSSLAGLFNESTVRGPAWRFLEIGRRVERCFGLLSVFEKVVSPADPNLRSSLFDYVLAANESLVAYRRRYRSDAVLDALVDLLLLDDANPRALAFQLDQLRSQLALLPARDGSSQLSDAIERSSAALVDMSWLPADADHRGSNGRREVIDRFVLTARAPLLDFADQLNVVYFNDPTRVRQLVGQIAGQIVGTS